MIVPEIRKLVKDIGDKLEAAKDAETRVASENVKKELEELTKRIKEIQDDL